MKKILKKNPKKSVENYFKKLPEALIIYIFSFFQVKDIRILSLVCHSWNLALNDATPHVICNKVGILPKQLLHPPHTIEAWKFAYQEHRDYGKKHEEIERLTESIQDDKVAIEEDKAATLALVPYGGREGGLITKKTCCSGFFGAGFGTGFGFLTSYFACSDMTGLFAFLGCLGGCVFGWTGGEYYIKRRVKKVEEQCNALQHSLDTAGTPLLCRTKSNSSDHHEREKKSVSPFRYQLSS